MKQAKIIPFKGNPSDIDPFVEKVASELSRSGLTNAAIALKVGAARGHKMSPETVAHVRDLASRRPQAYTLEWLLWACGKKFAIVNL